ncbi:formimidoylglutamase [Sphingobacterium sp. SRCM116780]|uniref:formimidoylglutamase n=1 Tax=Sphingobacterium sp. SRCM116780 TaxID=2907623 RepID=UPI001F34EA08|nr:formimidoylglutamase [Sphingobacterium sp. SRCM116780]UIR57728.1 formimidoylglutamase [Sphingobacterium sp. SRCM116780]
METSPWKYYSKGDQQLWNGRIDGTTEEHLRWHQVIRAIDLKTEEDLQGSFVLLGFASDEGVIRNLGRSGAVKGPETLKKTLSNLPVCSNKKIKLIDAGDVQCIDKQLEEAQEALGFMVKLILQRGGFPILLGGGHEITFGHYLGLKAAYNNRIGIINFDAHFDMRQPKHKIPTSGTGFYQIAELEKPINYLPIGIQKISNTQVLFDAAQANQIKWIEAQDFNGLNQETIDAQIDAFIDHIDHLYVTVDLDVFAVAYAPGVSATAFNGVVPDAFFLRIFNRIITSEKLVSIDIAELNPSFDIDGRTAKLAADLIFRVVNK